MYTRNVTLFQYTNLTNITEIIAASQANLLKYFGISALQFNQNQSQIKDGTQLPTLKHLQLLSIITVNLLLALEYSGFLDKIILKLKIKLSEMLHSQTKQPSIKQLL
jgi:hypothetical protein